MTWSVYGVELHMFTQLIRYVSGDLRAASIGAVPDELADTLIAVNLYAAVARGDTDAAERGHALEPSWSKDGLIALVAGGCTIDAHTWRGELEDAIALALRLLEHLWRAWSDYFLGGIWLVALALSALADAAQQERLLGRDVTERLALGDRLLERARTTAERGRPRGGRLGPEGRAWLARVHAEHSRLAGTNDVDLWRATVAEFDYGYRYEVARSRFRLAEALLENGDRGGRARRGRDRAGRGRRDGSGAAGDRRPGARAARPARPARGPGGRRRRADRARGRGARARRAGAVQPADRGEAVHLRQDRVGDTSPTCWPSWASQGARRRCRWPTSEG